MSWWLQRRRRRLLRRAPEGPMSDLLSPPWPELGENALEAELLALDLETTGLEPWKNDIVSIAWVPIEHGRIELGSAEHRLVRPSPEALDATSIRIHGVGHDRAHLGAALALVLEKLFAAMRGRVLVAHHASLDLGFLSEACRRLYGCNVSWPCIDTLELLHRQERRRQQPTPSTSLTLASARTRRGLPQYPTHNALWDAVAAAELWLSLSADWAGKGPLRLNRVVRLYP